jgi:hypothetical protein
MSVAKRERRSARRSGHDARCNGCSTGVGKLKTGLATGYGKTLELHNRFELVGERGFEPPTFGL